MSKNKKIRNIASYITLTILSVIWMIPVFWVVMTSFREESGSYTSYFFPKGLTIANYVNLLTDNSQFHFVKWFGNTLFVAVFSCLISTFFVLSVSYATSRMRFKMRKPMMNVALILGMFPSFMSMIAVYYILKGLGITQSLVALIMVYSGGAGLSFFIAKGFFDTLPKSLDEAAYLDGATKFQIFRKITLPMSKPIVVYTVLTSFMAPWMDFIFSSVIMGDNYNNYTVALGLFKMLEREFINDYYTQFAAGCVLVSIPIAALFISMQKYYVEGVSGGAVKG
ncbi:sugar ABC transporter permease [Clostridium sp. AF19-22AC]|nr:sugar ABC transporter permease [Clostridium sp. AF19-22AC]